MTEACDGSDMYSLSLPVSLHNDMSIVDMVSREMLCELVRNAFQQSIEQQLRHEQLLRQDFGRHSKGEVSTAIYSHLVRISQFSQYNSDVSVTVHPPSSVNDKIYCHIFAIPIICMF